MIKIIGPLGSHDASGHLRAPPIFSSSLRNRHARPEPAPPPPPSGGSLLFTNTNNHCSAATIGTTNQWPGTVEAWIKPKTNQGFVAGNYYGGDIAGHAIILDPTYLYGLAAFNAKLFGAFPIHSIALNSWSHLALTWDTPIITLWHNGINIATDTPLSYPLAHHTGYRVGGHQKSPDPKLDGHITQVRYSDVIRYTSNFTPATDFTTDANTVALWRMTEGTGTTVADASGNGHTLNFPVTNPPTWSSEKP